MQIAPSGPRLYRIAGTPAEHGGTMLATTAPGCRVRHRDFWSAMQRHSNGHLYLNFAGHGEDENLVRMAPKCMHDFPPPSRLTIRRISSA
jgi:hypothetical protein